MALLETLRRCHGDPTSFLLRFYFIRTQSNGTVFVHAQSARRRVAFYNVVGDSIATNEDAVVLLRCCRRLFCLYLGVLRYLRTHHDRLEIAAPVRPFISLWHDFEKAEMCIYHSNLYIICEL